MKCCLTGLHPPFILKPVVACGLPDSHQMALVFNETALQSVQMPLPTIVQQFANHGGQVVKVYVAGDKVS